MLRVGMIVSFRCYPSMIGKYCQSLLARTNRAQATPLATKCWTRELQAFVTASFSGWVARPEVLRRACRSAIVCTPFASCSERAARIPSCDKPLGAVLGPQQAANLIHEFHR